MNSVKQIIDVHNKKLLQEDRTRGVEMPVVIIKKHATAGTKPSGR